MDLIGTAAPSNHLFHISGERNGTTMNPLFQVICMRFETIEILFRMMMYLVLKYV